MAGLGVLIVVAVTVVLAATRGGIGVSRDSAVYLGTADRVAAGDGLRVPFRPYPLVPASDPLATNQRLNNFPPLYPVTLAGLSRLSGTGLRPTARVLNAVLLVTLVALVAATVYVASGRRVLFTAFVALSTLVAIDVLVAASMAWTELLFTVLVVVALLLVARQLDRPQWWALVACGAVVALAFLTRLAGAALVVAVVVALLLVSRRPWRMRLKEAAVVVVVGSLPVLLWTAFTAAGSDRVANRELAAHPIGSRALGRATETMASWLLPSRSSGQAENGLAGRLVATVGDLPEPVRVVAAVAAVGALFLLARRCRSPVVVPSSVPAVLPAVLLSFLGAYAGFLLVSGSLFDAALTRFDHRILMPAHVVALLAAGVLVAQRVDMARFWRPGLALAAPFAFLLVVNAGVAVVDGRQFAGVFASERWRSSPVMATVRQFPSDRVVVTNEPGAIWAVTGRSAAAVPEQKSVVTQRANPHLDADLVALGRAMRERGAVLVYVDGAGESSFAADEATLRARLPLALVRAEGDGRIYEISCPPPPERTSAPERAVC